ncbi:type VI secretion system Vgr family protein [Tenacibaculum geojense]|uniref:Type VI secretion system Vgr family protein n=1 Tax=Tenacibaculum geojense TaxID=915352 RepID=A0ABW3JRD4_9FLAO
MALQTSTIININGTEIMSFQRLTLSQDIDSNHILTLTCRMDVLEDIEGELINSSKEFLGELISVEVLPFEGFESNYGQLNFKGIITEVRSIKGHDAGSGDKILIKALSPSFLSDDGPHHTSHNEISLSEIVTKTFEDYDPSKLEVDIRPVNDPTIHYAVQHNESSYNFASRLAAQYGEWFYYDGEKLVFGEPDTDELELTYGFDLKEYQISLLPQSNNYKMYANDYLTDEIQEKATSETDAGLSGFAGFVSGKSSNIYTKETKIWHNLHSDTQVQQRLDTAVALQKKAIEVKQVEVRGMSDNPGVKLGSVVVIENNKYRVTNVSHTNNEVGDYHNSFTAITADINVYPFTNINAFPKSETQVGIVKDNADPDSLGRVKVQFPWQVEDDITTPWIRVLTPHAGADKGFHFIPEVEEQVLVGFEGGNAEHPFVMGSLYSGNGKPEEFATENNDSKIIRSRSGHTIELNDTEGEEKINIYDNEGSIIIFDTQTKSLTINATENIEIGAKNIRIVAEENIEIQAQGNISKAAEGDIAIQSQGATNIESQSDTTVRSNAAVAIEATSDATLSGTNAVVNGQTSAEVTGAQTKVSGSAMTEVSGGIVKIN